MTEDTGKLELYKPGGGRPNVFVNVKETQVPVSLEASERKSTIDLDPEKKKSASLYKRYLEDAPNLLGFLDDKVPPLSLSDKYIMAWQLLKDRGMVVVDTMRKINDHTIATTNLQANGSVYDIKIDRREERKRLINDEEFLLIPKEAIRQEVMRLVDVANKNGILLPHDGLFHVFVGDSDIDQIFAWKVVLLDFTEVTIYLKPSEMPEEKKEANKRNALRWLKDMEVVRENVQRGEEAYDSYEFGDHVDVV